MTFTAGVIEDLYENSKHQMKTQLPKICYQNTLPSSKSPSQVNSTENMCFDFENFDNRNFPSYREIESEFIPYTGNHFNFDILTYEREVQANDRLYTGANLWNSDDFFSIYN